MPSETPKPTPAASVDSLLAAGASAAERFAAESIELDAAWREGRLTEWIDEQVTQTREAAHVDG